MWREGKRERLVHCFASLNASSFPFIHPLSDTSQLKRRKKM